MILSAQSILHRGPIKNMRERFSAHGLTGGLGPAGYDICIAEDLTLAPGGFALASSLEEFDMPNDLLGIVHDKSTWARRGLCVQNTVIEPGWRGYLTLELTNHCAPHPSRMLTTKHTIKLQAGMPIAQIIFHVLDTPTNIPYKGKYQNQERGAQEAR